MIPLPYLLGIILGCLVAIAFGAGFVKLYINKRRLEVNQKKADLEAARKATDKEKLVGKRKVKEGDLFGVRALEHGYFGGVAQTNRPSSPAPSYKLAPEAKLVDWSQVNKLRSDSSSGASSDFDFFADKNSSTSTLPATGSTVKKPSPLRLQPSDAELKNHNMSSVGNIGGNFLPPVPSPRSLRAPSPFIEEEKTGTWVSPLDVHFSRPATPIRPTSFLPKLQLPLEFGKGDDLFSKPIKQAAPASEPVIVKPPPTAQGRVKTPKEIYAEFSQQGFAKSPTLSNFSQQSSAQSPTFSTFSKEEPNAKSPTFSAFPQQAPPRPNRLSMKSMFATEEPTTRPSKDDFSSTFQLPPVPLDDLAPAIPPVNPDRFPKDLQVWNPSSPVRDSILNRQHVPNSTARSEWALPSDEDDDAILDSEWQPSERAIIRASIVSKQRVSVVMRPGAHESQDLDVHYGKTQTLRRGYSMAASSMYSTRTSILEPEQQFPPRHSRTRSQSSEVRRSYSRHGRSSSRSLSRTRDSLRESSRKTSSETFRSADSHRRSRDRDQLHFDPTSQQRNRSGSVQGRAIDFDQPRDSPFSNSHQAKSTHSANSSISSTSSSRNNSPPRPILKDNYQASSTAPLQPRLPFQDPDRLSIAQPQIHGRSGSEASQNSIGDFYDSYYRQSTLNPNNPNTRTSIQDRAQMFEDRNRNRPAQLKIGTGYGGFNTIVEVATPVPSPSPLVLRERERERFPTMI